MRYADSTAWLVATILVAGTTSIGPAIDPNGVAIGPIIDPVGIGAGRGPGKIGPLIDPDG